LVLGSSVGLLDGLGQGTARAAARLPELGEEAIERITAIAPRASTRDADQIAAEMRRHGHILQLTVIAADTWRLVAQTSEDLRSISRLLLDTVAALSSDDVPLTAAQRWRLPVLCDFLVLLGLGDVSVPDFRDVRHDPDTVRTLWLRLVALGAGHDLARLAAEARAALNEDATVSHDREPAPFDLASVWPVTDDRSLDPGQISATDRSAAVRLLAAESDWVAHSAARLLWEAGAESGLAGEVADILTPELTVGRRLLVAALSCVLSMDPAAAAAAHFNSSDPARRRAAAMLASDVDGGRQLELLRARALDDDDATVRIAAGAASFEEPGRPPPTYWSCPACGERNDPAEESCPACDEDRPAPARA
jgi:rubrerythrin